MVLEHVFPEDWLENRARYAFLLGVGYTLFSVSISSLLFPKNPALVSVAFISLLLLPELYKIFDIEERQEMMESRFSLPRLFADDWDVTKVYIFLFLGILLTYSVSTIVLDNYASGDLFRDQLEFRGKAGGAGSHAAGKAIEFSPGLFSHLLSNNFKVLIACFLMALLTGNGGIFLIVWNASVWGTIFGITAKAAATAAGVNPFFYFALILLIVFPHMIVEALSYFLASISGSIISKDVLLEKFRSERFWFVFKFNSYLFIFSLVFLVLGALIETFVLNNVTLYSEIIQLSLSVP
ncbi:stage II sporulation protein M [Candidatus Woesearchaeota archaeon]|nr:stage II sporulation protein M [Candidatus Woesearchaeota archaeon]